MKKRILSLLLILCMAVTLLPTAAFAEEATGTPGTPTEDSEEPQSTESGTSSAGGTIYVDAANGDDAQEDVGTTAEKAYQSIGEAVKAAESGDTIQLGEGNYSLYDVCGKNGASNSEEYTKNKDLTFIGAGPEETKWGIGPEVPDPKYYNTEYNGDYCFDGAGTITFQNMTLQSGSVDYLGFIRADNTVVDACVVNGMTTYWGYKSAVFKNTTFNCPNDYAIHAYSSHDMLIEKCIFKDAKGKAVKIYNEGGTSINLTFKDNTVISQKEKYAVINVDDRFNNFTVDIIGHNSISGPAKVDIGTCSRLFGFSNGSCNTGKTIVNFNGTTVWEDGKMVDAKAYHNEGITVRGVSYDNGVAGANDSLYAEGYKDNEVETTATDWVEQEDGSYTRTVTRKCKYCNYSEEVEETKALFPVELVIYRNGDTSNPYKRVRVAEVAKGTEIKAADYPIENYYDGTNSGGKYDFYGWYNDHGWNTYEKNPDNPLTGLEKITVNGWTNLKCMVYDYEKVVYFNTAEDLKAYQNHDGAVSPLFSTTARKGSTLPTADAPTATREGYTFKFWSREGQSVDVTGQTVNGWTNLYANWEKDESQTKTTSYTVQHKVDGKIIEEDTKTYTNTAWINEAKPTIAIVPDSLSPKSYDGYEYVGMEPEIITDTVASGTTITLTYEKRTDLSYTVHYYLKDTTKQVADDKTVDGQTFNADVTENAIPIRGYRVYGDSVKSITIGTGTNDIIFYYTRAYHPSTPSKPTLNTGDHYAYVMGYPDGTVRPNGSITRAEVSAILFRLLSDKTRDEYFTTESSFTDVKAGAWYNNSIATLEKAGVIVDTAKGGAFRPNEAITRAELAAMLAQFSDAKPVKGVKFSDVSAEHWAYEAIAIAAKMGWIEGYPDGTFRPDATITRAEMMTLVNRALERVPSDEDHLLSKRVMLTFPDCKSGDWFYIAVQEATNSHTYERAATEKNGDEQWTALRANRDWTRYEH